MLALRDPLRYAVRLNCLTGDARTNERVDRLSLFTCYDTVCKRRLQHVLFLPSPSLPPVPFSSSRSLLCLRLPTLRARPQVNSKWGKDTTDPAVVLTFPPLRQTLFRGVWAEGSNKCVLRRLALRTSGRNALNCTLRIAADDRYFDTANRSSIWTQPAAARQSLREGSSRFYKDDKSKPNADNNALGDGRGLISSAARSEDRQAASKAAKAKADKKLAAARL
eukprot:SAG31_NODE_112_length_24420_cov_19.787550_15_plen_222_part_00